MNIDYLISPQDLLNRKFTWSGMEWQVADVDGDFCLLLRPGEVPEPNAPWTSRLMVETLVIGHVADQIPHQSTRKATA